MVIVVPSCTTRHYRWPTGSTCPSLSWKMAGDAYFPDYHAFGRWRISSEQLFQADDKNPVDYRFLPLERER